jgi:hypothetical protein
VHQKPSCDGIGVPRVHDVESTLSGPGGVRYAPGIRVLQAATGEMGRIRDWTGQPRRPDGRSERGSQPEEAREDAAM